MLLDVQAKIIVKQLKETMIYELLDRFNENNEALVRKVVDALNIAWMVGVSES